MDRDKFSTKIGEGPGPHVDVHVICVVWHAKSGDQRTLNGTLSVDVLDENDNPPIPQSELFIDKELTVFNVVSFYVKNTRENSVRISFSVHVLNRDTSYV